VSKPCEICDRPQGDDATFCAADAHRLDAALADVCAYRGLAYDLDDTLARQTHLHLTPEEAAEEKRAPGVLVANPLPYNPRASKAGGNLKAVLVSWTRLVVEEAGDDWPADSLTAVASLIRKRVGWLRHHPAGADAYEEITDAVRAARRAVDRRADMLYAGPCDCGEDLYARLGAEYVQCHDTAHERPAVWNVADRREWLLDSAQEVLLTTTEICQALALYALNTTPEALRGYKARGRLTERGTRVENGRTAAVFRLGDVLDILQRQAERVSA
jgi:hypothetical protein